MVDNELDFNALEKLDEDEKEKRINEYETFITKDLVGDSENDPDKIIEIISKKFIFGNRYIVRYANDGMMLHTIILGKTGVGKSCISRILCSGSGIAIKEYNDIYLNAGKNSVYSDTKLPRKFMTKLKNFMIWDTPGFFDTGKVYIDICNNFYIQKIIENYKENEPLIYSLVLSHEHFKRGVGENNYLIICKYFDLFGPKADLESILRSTILIINKANKLKVESLIKQLEKFRDQGIDDINKTEEEKNKILTFFNFFIKNDPEKRILFFRQPNISDFDQNSDEDIQKIDIDMSKERDEFKMMLEFYGRNRKFEKITKYVANESNIEIIMKTKKTKINILNKIGKIIVDEIYKKCCNLFENSDLIEYRNLNILNFQQNVSKENIQSRILDICLDYLTTNDDNLMKDISDFKNNFESCKFLDKIIEKDDNDIIELKNELPKMLEDFFSNLKKKQDLLSLKRLEEIKIILNDFKIKINLAYRSYIDDKYYDKGVDNKETLSNENLERKLLRFDNLSNLKETFDININNLFTIENFKNSELSFNTITSLEKLLNHWVESSGNKVLMKNYLNEISDNLNKKLRFINNIKDNQIMKDNYDGYINKINDMITIKNEIIKDVTNIVDEEKNLIKSDISKKIISYKLEELFKEVVKYILEGNVSLKNVKHINKNLDSLIKKDEKCQLIDFITRFEIVTSVIIDKEIKPLLSLLPLLEQLKKSYNIIISSKSFVYNFETEIPIIYSNDKIDIFKTEERNKVDFEHKLVKIEY